MDQPQRGNATQKAALRQEALARRDGLDPVSRAAASGAIAARALSLILMAEPRIVSGYWPMRSEVDPRGLLLGLRGAGITIALPVIIARQELRFLEWRKDAHLVAGGFGTSEPPPESPEAIPDVILLPLAGFDRAGHRIGYGKGHYDKAIAGLFTKGARPELIGLAFSVQEVSRVPAEPHDMRLDRIVTERETLDFRES